MKLRSCLFALLCTVLTSACATNRSHAPAEPVTSNYSEPARGAAAPPPTTPGDADEGYAQEGPGRSEPAPRAEAPADGEARTARAPRVSGGRGAPVPQAAPKSASAEDYAPQRARPREDRPGLGTTWGEDRESRIRSTSFVRANGNQPFDTVSLWYNDSNGIDAMTRGAGWSPEQAVFPTWQGVLTVRLTDEYRNPLPSLSANGRRYVVGEHGQRYLINVRNDSPNRVEIVATVDGLDVMDGRAGSFAKRGYVVAPYSDLDIEGFRRSDATVASFRFGSVRDSYAERKGEGRNVGVIGIAFFAEAGATWPWTPEEVRRRHDADPFPGRYAAPPPPRY